MNTNAASPTAPAIGVALAASFARRGECVADARAYEAAGCDSLWVGGIEDPWLAAAALGVATTRVRLVVPVADDEVGTAALARRVATLQRLLPERLAVRCSTAAAAVAARAIVHCPVYGPEDDPVADAIVAAAEAVLGAELAQRPPAQRPVWLLCGAMRDRAAWRELRERWRAAGAGGAIGLVLDETPGLLDLLRNPDRDVDRPDLVLAHG